MEAFISHLRRQISWPNDALNWTLFTSRKLGTLTEYRLLRQYMRKIGIRRSRTAKAWYLCMSRIMDMRHKWY